MNEQERAIKFIEELKNLQEEWGFYVVRNQITEKLVAQDYWTNNQYEIEDEE